MAVEKPGKLGFFSPTLGPSSGCPRDSFLLYGKRTFSDSRCRCLLTALPVSDTTPSCHRHNSANALQSNTLITQQIKISSILQVHFYKLVLFMQNQRPKVTLCNI